MDSWKTLLITLLALVGTQAVGAENANPIDKGLIITTFLPTILIAGTTSLTTEPPETFKSAKTDALAFIGSDGEIRGAEFEQASRYYRSAYTSPHMSDMQLAQAIATSY
ncbi:DUF2388 domain-containing protein [Pseudomonas sp. R2-7-07]|uniref:DUF2388 domain-containing protein n=1 Tax=Pseudomonas sp. R2-7-07 TaxID=658641 RepID=UPI000F56DF9A|nr:DUF2388 domain-containing protein [Pseudomonas sp. R2-7-07]AZF48590.1 hypothetical protein C4J86_3362 [Pseudomonas sp. R2-7-07]